MVTSRTAFIRYLVLANETQVIVARKSGVIAGLAAVAVVLDEMEIEVQFHSLVQDGDAVAAGAVLATISGMVASN